MNARHRSLLAQLMMLTITLAGLYYVGYRVLGGSSTNGDLELTIELPESGGIFEKSEVTYRGVRVGTVKHVDTFPDHVAIRLVVDPDADIPRDTLAQVTYLSPIGEQLVEFRPRSSGPPYLRNGDVIKAPDVGVADQFGRLLLNVNTLMDSVDEADLRTVVDELALAFPGNSQELTGLIDDSDASLATLEKLTPAITRILENSRKPLATLNHQAPNLTRFAIAAEQLAAQISDSVPDIGSLIDNGLTAVNLSNQFLDDNARRVQAMFGVSAELLGMISSRFPALRATLRAFPDAMRALASYTRGGKVNATVFAVGPTLCAYDQARRKPWDLQDRPIYDNSACPHPNGTLERGWHNAPGTP